MARLLSHLLGDDLHTLLLLHWLDVRSVTTLDIAVSSNASRPYWMSLIRSVRATSIDNMVHSASSLIWLIQRGINVTRIQMKINAWRLPGCDLSLLTTADLLHFGLDGCSSITDGCLLKMVNGCDGGCRGEGLSVCNKEADAGVSALGHMRRTRQSISLEGCVDLVDRGFIALGAGCGHLQSINLESCRQVTDAGVIALGAGCGQLQSINLSGCNKVTDAGVIALGHGCGQLQKICLSYCRQVTDDGITALRHGCVHLLRINRYGLRDSDSGGGSDNENDDGSDENDNGSDNVSDGDNDNDCENDDGSDDGSDDNENDDD